MKQLLFYLLLLSSVLKGAPPPGYTLVFNDDFKESALTIISNDGPIVPPVRWIAQMPDGLNFGEAYTGFYTVNYPIANPNLQTQTTGAGQLQFEAWYNPAKSHWVSGLIASVDPQGRGFSQALGYWEARIRWTGGLGTWPAFWLQGVNNLKPRTTNSAEVDILEAYGEALDKANQHIHIWTPAGKDVLSESSSCTYNLTNTWHVYGCRIAADYTYWTIDGNEVFRAPTPVEATEPLYCIVDLEMGGGWPIPGPGPYYMWVQYVRCYAPPK